MKRDHDSVLYVGNDKYVIEHLNRISVCHTYWVKTTGMLRDDMAALEQHYFENETVIFQKDD